MFTWCVHSDGKVYKHVTLKVSASLWWAKLHSPADIYEE